MFSGGFILNIYIYKYFLKFIFDKILNIFLKILKLLIIFANIKYKSKNIFQNDFKKFI